jgi:ribulose-5-phosphate 4-epimerase/fuculose-1-phosphate aldolase
MVRMSEENLICMPEEEILRPREIIIDLMADMVKGGYTDYSGGNMALRVGKRIYSTQTHSADYYRWRLKPDDIICTDIEGNFLEGVPLKISREADLHYLILKEFPDIRCSLHGNSFWSPLLVSSSIKPEPVTLTALDHKIKHIPVVPESVFPMTREEYSFIISEFRKLKSRGEAMVVIMPYHGILVAAQTHNEAFSLVDTLENNSKFLVERAKLRASCCHIMEYEQKYGKRFSDNPLLEFENKNSNAGKYDFSEKLLSVGNIEDLAKSGCKTINVCPDCIITSTAENRAESLGIKIIK